MIKFNGNSILLVENDHAYAYQFKQTLEEKGAIVVVSPNLKDAKNCLNHSDFDLVISSHKFSDGNVRDLFEWAKDSLSTLPVLSVMGNCTQLEKKQLDKLGIKIFLSKSDSIKLFEDISKALFSFDDFKKSYLESRYERGIAYELSAAGNVIQVKALEIMEKGVYLSFEKPFTSRTEVSLKLICCDDLHIESVTVKGFLQGEFSEGQFFKVNDDDLSKWEILLSQLYQKQDEVTQFLKKASGT